MENLTQPKSTQLNPTPTTTPSRAFFQGLAFVKDPDGYWIEVLAPNSMRAMTRWPGNQE